MAYIFPKKQLPQNVGKNLFEEKKFGKKTQLLKDFYQVKKPLF